MYNNPKTIVVGTTADYIELLQQTCPGRILFITDPMVREKASEPQPAPDEELICSLNNDSRVLNSLRHHIEKWNLTIEGITCFDCESMELAAKLAQYYSLSYPAVNTIRNSRDKYRSKLLWQQQDIPCPRAGLIHSPEEAADFFTAINGPCVMKPCTGSGSELVFRCDSAAESKTAALLILQGLEARKDHPLYRTRGIDSPAIIAEEFVSGTEYSCDFIIENSSIKIIRLTRKIISSMSPFGTIMGYIIETVMPGDQGELESILHRGARALGISEAICMADFMVNDGRIMLLEITPRPGGDCLPMLLQHALGIDILSLTIEFARRQSITLNTHNSHPPAVGLRIIAAQGGILKHIDISELEKDNRARDIKILKHPGHLICMPPDDYDSWLLGHLVFHPDMDIDIKQQSNDLISKIKVNIKLCSSLTKTTS